MIPNSIGERILIVDDEPSLAQTLAVIFQHAGYSATAVFSGKEALDWVAVHPPALVISDVIMPDLNGIELAKAIRVTYPSCPVLLFSGNADTQQLLDKAQIEGHEFEVLAKPVPPPQMLARVASLLEQDKAARSNS